jgi:Fe-Mn family superoxide dismutase
MPYELKPLSCNPGAIAGMSEKIIVSHYENNYGGAVKRLNAIERNWPDLTGLRPRYSPSTVSSANRWWR